jgi:hypothetical protein
MTKHVGMFFLKTALLWALLSLVLWTAKGDLWTLLGGALILALFAYPAADLGVLPLWGNGPTAALDAVLAFLFLWAFEWAWKRVGVTWGLSIGFALLVAVVEVGFHALLIRQGIVRPARRHGVT